MRTETSERWVRGWVGETVVAESRTPLLFWADDFPVPNYAFAPDEVSASVLRPVAAPTELAVVEWFFGPQSAVTQWFDLVVGDRVIPHAAWTLADLPDRIVLSWQPGVLDRWTEEDEEVVVHPRDPHKRVDALPSSRHVRVLLDGVVLADTTAPVLLFETGLPTRYYLPPEDVVMAALLPSDTTTTCPYKGTTTGYWSLPGLADIAWAYGDPLPAVQAIAGRIAFFGERLDIEVDGVRLERPVTGF